MILNIDSSAIKGHADTLKAMTRSAFPVAVRQTLNSAAFDVKKVTMPESVSKNFIQRKPSFFKATSKVEMAQGFDVSNMRAIVGFTKRGTSTSEDWAVKDLEDQEMGGEIGGRSLIPLSTARISGSNLKNVQAKNRIQALKSYKVIDAHKTRVMKRNPEWGKPDSKARQEFIRSRTPKQQFIRAAFKAQELYGANAYVLGNRFSGGKRTLSRINSISSNDSHTSLKISRTPLYTFKPNRKIQVARTNFMRRASLESGMKMDKIFVDAAIKQFKKFQTYK